MRARASARHSRRVAPRVSEDGIAPVSVVWDDEEDAFCDSYLVAARDGDIPALQEYLQELRAD